MFYVGGFYLIVMSSTAGDLYRKLYESYKKCHPTQSGHEIQMNTNKLWSEAKEKFSVDKKEFENHVLELIRRFNEKATKKKVI